MNGVEVLEVGRGSRVEAEPGVPLSLSSEGVRSSVPGYEYASRVMLRGGV